MWKNDKSLVVTASNKNNELLHIKFKILDTDIGDRWLSMIKQNQEANPQRVGQSHARTCTGTPSASAVRAACRQGQRERTRGQMI